MLTRKCNVCERSFDVSGQGKGKAKYCTDECKKFVRRNIPVGQINKVYKKFKEIKECPICGLDFKSDADKRVDHCHTTGYVKGILCDKCNVGLGCLKDDYDTVHRALDYLNEEQI